MGHEITTRTFDLDRATEDYGLRRADVVADGDHFFAVVQWGGHFHLLPAFHREAEEGYHGAYYYIHGNISEYGRVHRPVAADVTVEDVRGARYAHDDGEAWRFAHCSPDEHLDFAAEAEAFARAQFAPAIQSATAMAAAASSNQGRNTHYAKAQALILLAGMVGRRVHEVVVGAVLGHYHRNPHHDHKRELTVAALDRVMGTWKQNSAADATARHNHARTEEAAAEVRKRLASADSIEWRHAREAREQLEALRKAVRGADPVDGFEYIFTTSTDGAAITELVDLPDPSWPADHAALAKGVTRGAYVYYDGMPGNIGPGRPFAVAFKRAVGGTDWVFVRNVRIYGGRQ